MRMSDISKEYAAGTDAPVRETEETGMKMMIDDTVVPVVWEDNAAVKALAERVKKKAAEVEMSRYGGFEQVGDLGFFLPAEAVRITTDPGDIVLYGRDQIVVFYGQNTWAYTKLGHIGSSPAELKKLLGNGNVTVTIMAGEGK